MNDKTKNYRYAISHNSEITIEDDFDKYAVYRSSGMIWELCTIQSNKCMDIRNIPILRINIVFMY